MAEVDQSAVTATLSSFLDPESGRGVTETGPDGDIKVQGDSLSLTLALTTHSAILRAETHERLTQLLHARFPQLQHVTVNLAVHERPAEKLGQIGLAAKSVVAVGSGKGGVGKSTIAASMALGLARAG